MVVNPFMRDKPLNREEVLELRKKAHAISTPSTFTCDDCDIVNKCKLAFDLWNDLWNTDDDCLLEK